MSRDGSPIYATVQNRDERNSGEESESEGESVQ